MFKANKKFLEDPSRFTSSIALVESAKIDCSDFGTSFLIDKSGQATFWLTCAHVIKSIKNPDNIRIGELPAKLISPSKDQINNSLRENFDLALLKVEGLYNKRKVQLAWPISRNLRFITTGFYQQPKTKELFLEEISGRLHAARLNAVAGGKYAWVLDLDVDDNLALEPGYSGSPIFVPNTRKVVGVVEQRQASGKKGKAISIDAAKSVIRGVPELKIMLQKFQSSQQSIEEGFADWTMGVLEHPLRWMAGSQTRAALDWFLQEGFSTLAKKSSDYAFNISRELNEEIQRFPEKHRPEVIADFQWEIEKYLERIYGSLLTKSQDLLEHNVIRPSLSLSAYESAFLYIKNSVPSHISERIFERINCYIDVLIDNLYSDF